MPEPQPRNKERPTKHADSKRPSSTTMHEIMRGSLTIEKVKTRTESRLTFRADRLVAIVALAIIIIAIGVTF